MTNKLNGSDRADYGDKLLSELAKRLTGINVSNCSRRLIYRYLRFYRLYPQIVGTPSPQLKIPPEKLVYWLSYSHLELIVDLDDPLKRTFYENECIRGNCSVREFKRQIGSLYYERSGLSENKEKLAELVQSGTETIELEIDSVQGISISKLKSTNDLQNKWQPYQIYISESVVESLYKEEIVLN